jgi:hypothetical protein
MALAPLSLALLGLLAPDAFHAPRGALAPDGPCLRAGLGRDLPAPPDPLRHTRQRPRACLEETSPYGLEAEAARPTGGAAEHRPAAVHNRGPQSRSARLPHVPLIYSLCTLLI